MLKPKKQIPLVKDKEQCERTVFDQKKFNDLLLKMANTKPIDIKELKVKKDKLIGK